MSDGGALHIPVLCGPLMGLLEYDSGSVVVDATIGHGGHALALSRRLSSEGRLIGLDVDAESLGVARGSLSGVDCRVELLRENFGDLKDVLARSGVEQVEVILADIGMCSGQLADPLRGFSFRDDGPLDMRLDDRLSTTAADLVNRLNSEELADVIYKYGQERHSRRIAGAIVHNRQKGRFERTGQLVEVIRRALGIRGKGHKGRIHPATRTFQALRIAVNDELGQLQRLLDSAGELLKPGGQVAIISFHSLEDRLVKNDFRQNRQAGRYEVLTPKPIVADQAERRQNPRSRSAKLRVARYVGE